jgi:hypothetical protein
MIPFFAIVRIARRSGRSFRLWLPLFLIWLLLAPIVLVLLPFLFLYCVFVRINPFRAFATVWGVLSALRGTHIEVTTGRDAVLVRIF